MARVAGKRIVFVDGEHVRNCVSLEFTMGGNSAIYPAFVPKGTIWLDRSLEKSPIDCSATALHEAVEEKMMRRYGWNYDAAHDVADSVEAKYRAHMMIVGPPKQPLKEAEKWYREWCSNLPRHRIRRRKRI